MKENLPSAEYEKYDLNNPQECHLFFMKLVDKEFDIFYKSSYKDILNLFPYDTKLRCFGSILSDKEFWRMLFLQNGVFTTYGKLRSIIAQHNCFNLPMFIRYSHMINNDTKDTDINCGLDYLLDKHHLRIINKNGNPVIEQISEYISSTDLELANTHSQYSSALSTINNILSSGTNTSYYIGYTPTGKGFVCNAFYFEIVQYFIGKKAVFKDLLYYKKDRPLTPALFLKYYKSYFTLIKDIKDDIYSTAKFDIEFYNDLKPQKDRPVKIDPLDFAPEKLGKKSFARSDIFHLRTLIENRFRFEIIDCLFQNIAETTTLFPYMGIIEHIPKLVSCIYLPPYPISYYLLDAIFSRLNHTTFDLRIKSNVFQTILDSFIDNYMIFINRLTTDLLPFYYEDFFSNLYYAVEHGRKVKSSCTDVYINMYEVLRNYINSDDCSDTLKMISGHGFFSEKKMFDNISINSSIDVAYQINLLRSVELFEDYNSSLEEHMNNANNTLHSKKKLNTANNLTFADYAHEPFVYSHILKEIRPQKKNLIIYDKCLHEMNKITEPPTESQKPNS